MESEILSEVVKFELRRFAVVFGIGVGEWEVSRERHGFGIFHRGELSNTAYYVLLRDNGQWLLFMIGAGEAFGDGCRVSWYSGSWQCKLANSPVHNGLMARALYLLGFDDEEVVEQLPRVSAHDQIELRLSHPREFWPPKWWAEESRG